MLFGCLCLLNLTVCVQQTAVELDTTVQRCKSVVMKSGEAHVKADNERVTIKKDLDVASTELNTIQ